MWQPNCHLRLGGVAERCLLRNIAGRQLGRKCCGLASGRAADRESVALGYVPSKDREEKWRLSALRCDFLRVFLGGFLGFLRCSSGL